MRRAIPEDIDDATAAIVRFTEGMTGTIVTLASSARIWQLRVVGSEGWADMRNHDVLTICRKNGEREEMKFPTTDYPHVYSIAAELEEFAAATEGKATYRISTDEMINATATLEAMIKSAEFGKRVATA